MCEPATIASIAVGVMSSVASAAAQMQQASKAAQAQDAMNAQIRANAEINARQQADAAANAAATDYQLASMQQDQIMEQTAQEENQRAMLAMRERAALRVSSGEAGVAGVGIDRLEGDIQMQKSFDISTLETNKQNQINQIQASKKAIETTAQSRINQGVSQMNEAYAMHPRVSGPSGWASGLQIGAAAIGGGMTGYSWAKANGLTGGSSYTKPVGQDLYANEFSLSGLR